MDEVQAELDCCRATVRRTLHYHLAAGRIERSGQAHGAGVLWSSPQKRALCNSVFALAQVMTIESGGQRVSLAEAASRAGLDTDTVLRRMSAGLSLDAALK